MSLKKVHDDQPKEFKFSVENLKKIIELQNKTVEHDRARELNLRRPKSYEMM